MTEQTLPLALKTFNDKVKLMNQRGGRDLLLSANDARNLHSEIFSLLAQIAELTKSKDQPAEPVVRVQMDGGNF